MKVRDCDGDIWEEDGEGGWELHDPDLFTNSYLPNREILEQIWGPLTEVTE